MILDTAFQSGAAWTKPFGNPTADAREQARWHVAACGEIGDDAPFDPEHS